MVRNRLVRFLVNNTQFEQICFNAKSKGYESVSEFLRDIATKNNLYVEQKIQCIDKKLAILEVIADSMKLEGKLKIRPSIEPSKTPSWFKELKEKGVLD